MNEKIPINDLDLNEEQLAKMFRDEWSVLAPVAYSNYLKSGRGIVFVDLSMVLAQQDEMQVDTKYIPALDVDKIAEFSSKASDMVRIYDPEKMVLFWIKLRDGQSVGMYLGSDNGLQTPKKLYENQQRLTVH